MRIALGMAAAMAAIGPHDDAAAGDQLIVPASVEPGAVLHALYRFDRPVTGHGRLEAEWTDVVGRLVARRVIPLALTGTRAVRFSLPYRQAVTVKNAIRARIVLDEAGRRGRRPVHQVLTASASFAAPPPVHPWSDYQIIMWQQQTPAGYAALRQLGVTGAAVLSERGQSPGPRELARIEPVLDADLGWHLENAATDFYSPYHKWEPDRPANWRFREAQARYRQDPGDRTALVRQPSLSDPAWLRRITDRLSADVRTLRRFRPLFYNLGDEPGIGDLTAFWDFDLSRPSLGAMRAWLKQRYRTLARLNAEWGSAYRRWDAIVPMTTREAVTRRDQNFAAWGDFKEWMDVAFAVALKAGSDAIHAADPEALSAIEGGQIPGWGGYDYKRLAASIDAMELGDAGDNVEMLRAFNPRAVMLTTSFAGGAIEQHRLWRELLRGTRGLVLWDPDHRIVDQDGGVRDRGREAEAFFRELRGGLGALLINSRRREDPIATLYSPPSMRIGWLLDRIRAGDDWSRRSAETEDEDNPLRRSLRRYARAIEHLGLQHRFVSDQQIEGGGLVRDRYRVLVLPQTIALSDRAANRIRDFVRAGGTVVADGEPGIFDDHGHRRKTPVLADLFSSPAAPAAVRGVPGRGQAISLEAPGPQDRGGNERLRDILRAAGIEPLVSLVRRDGRPTDDVETYVFDAGSVTIVALSRDADATAGQSPPRSGETETVELALPGAYQIYDVRAQRRYSPAARLRIEIGSVGPVVLALSHRPLPAPEIVGPSGILAGKDARFRIAASGHSGFARGVFHIEVVGPDGITLPYYGGNLTAPAGAALRYTLPLAVNDKGGIWTIRARDLLTGATATKLLRVQP